MSGSIHPSTTSETSAARSSSNLPSPTDSAGRPPRSSTASGPGSHRSSKPASTPIRHSSPSTDGAATQPAPSTPSSESSPTPDEPRGRRRSCVAPAPVRDAAVRHARPDRSFRVPSSRGGAVARPGASSVGLVVRRTPQVWRAIAGASPGGADRAPIGAAWARRWPAAARSSSSSSHRPVSSTVRMSVALPQRSRISCMNSFR